MGKSRKKNRQHAGERTSAVSLEKPESANASNGHRRFVLLAVISTVCAFAIIAVVVWLTPMAEEVLPKDAPSFAHPHVVELPHVAKQIDVEELQNELRTLAELMPDRFPQDPASYHLAAQIYAELKQSRQAEELWTKCLELKPDALDPYLGLAKVFMSGGRDDEARTLLQQAKQSFDATVGLLLTLGEAQENLGEIEEARKEYQECAAQFPQVGKAWLALGRVQIQQSQFPDAEQSIRKAIELDGPSGPALVSLTTSLVRQRKTEEAAKIREQIVASQDKTQLDNSNFQEQYTQALRGIAANMLHAAAEIEEQHGNSLEASNYCLQAIAMQPRHLQAYVSLSSIYRKAEQFLDAVVVEKRLLELQPDKLINYSNLARVQLQAGDNAGAEATLKQLITRDSMSSTARIALARLHLTSGRVSEAHRLATEIIARNPTSEAYELLALTFESAGDQTMANVAFEKAKQLKKADAEKF